MILDWVACLEQRDIIHSRLTGRHLTRHLTPVTHDTFYTHLTHGAADAAEVPIAASASERHRAAATQSLFGQQPRATSGEMSGPWAGLHSMQAGCGSEAHVNTSMPLPMPTRCDVMIGELNHDDAYKLGYAQGMVNAQGMVKGMVTAQAMLNMQRSSQHKAGLFERGRQKLEFFSTGLASPPNLACFTLAS